MSYGWGATKLSFGLPRRKRDYSQDRSCLVKIAYGTWADAEDGCVRTIDLNQSHGVSGGHLLAYHCDYGEHWHVGHAHGPRQDAGFESKRRVHRP